MVGLWAAVPREQVQTSSDPAASLPLGLWAAGPWKQVQTALILLLLLCWATDGGPDARPSGPSGQQHVAEEDDIEKK